MPVHASQLYARNVTELLKELVKDGALALDFEDEVVQGACVTHDGADRERGGEGRRRDAGTVGMTSELEVGLYIFMLAGFLGYHIITRVPPLLHTPLMSATNAIAAISLVGSLVVAGSDYSEVPERLGVHAARLRRRHLLGDQRLRRLPHHRPHAAHVQDGRAATGQAPAGRAAGAVAASPRFTALVVAAAARRRSPPAWRFGEYLASTSPAELLRYAYIVSAAMFVLGLKGLSSPKWARAGMFLAALRHVRWRWSARCFHPHIVNYRWIGARACSSARSSAARWASAFR